MNNERFCSQQKKRLVLFKSKKKECSRLYFHAPSASGWLAGVIEVILRNFVCVFCIEVCPD